MNWARVAVGSFILGALALFLAVVYGPPLFPPSANSVQDHLATLTVIISILGLGIGLFVFSLLIYAVWKFRAGPGRIDHRVPDPKTHDSNLEFWWTAIPVAILVTIGILSFQALQMTDNPDLQETFVVHVTGQQWQWSFTYPDNTTSTTELWVREGSLVKLLIGSKDVIHSFYAPSFGVKMDAVPGYTNVQWLHAEREGVYSGQCAEFCGLAHSAMLLKVVVFNASESRMWGPPPLPPAGTAYTATLSDTAIALRDANGTAVADLAADIQESVLLRVVNNGTQSWDLTFGAPWSMSTGPISAGNESWLNFTVDWSVGAAVTSTNGGSGTARIRTDLSQVFDIELFDKGPSNRAIHPSALRLPRGKTAYLRVWNNGTEAHNFLLGEDAKVGIKEAFTKGTHRWIVFVPEVDSSSPYYCGVPGHRSSGMEGLATIGRGGAVTQRPAYGDSWLWFIALGAFVLILIFVRWLVYRVRHGSYDDPPRT